MESKTPLVSVIVPAYNAEKYIVKCIESVIKQTYSNLELILVDDGSTDTTGRLCDKYSKEDKRVCVIHKKNAGVAAARNTGLQAATGKYIVFLDSDDWLDLDIVECAVKNYREDCLNLWGFVCYWPNNVIETERLVVLPLAQNELVANAIYLSTSKEYNLGNYYRATCGKIFERNLIENYQIAFPEGLFIGEDAVFLVNYLTRVTGINLVSQRGYNYNHLNENSATTKYQSHLYEQSEYQYNALMHVVQDAQLENNEEIRTAFVNFRWWMVACLSMNSLRGFLQRKVSIFELMNPLLQWISSHQEEMKESVSDISLINPAYQHIYRYRNHLSKLTLFVHYFLYKAVQKIFKKIVKKKV